MTSNTNYSGGVNGTMDTVSAVGDATALAVVNTSNTNNSALWVSNFGTYYGATIDTGGPYNAGLRARNLATTSGTGAAIEAVGGLQNGINVLSGGYGINIGNVGTGVNVSSATQYGAIFNGTNNGVSITVSSATGPGLVVNANGGYSGLFQGGNVLMKQGLQVLGFINKSGGGYTIDHPQFPETKLLTHCFVESPEMKNVYDGVAVLDTSGSANVKLPSYFEAANSTYRYQLTAMGVSMPGLYVSKEVNGNTFSISGGVPGAKVSWQVTGVRADKWALANHPGVEIDKPTEKHGTYLHPELFGHGEEKSYHPKPEVLA